ncbi:hypothetical protein DDB_G0283139 [Dictyostelium discoideum AX4]|uniref:MRH domain-containing protein n=1 Tax=Dictyostelium discoideum TaxID=44689 RepID=Q54RK4_DICDI|nr:hypothetical protein DDB_G0283139 [Dictyostelium discoideum AX4]EAL65899.2 hypothetical protein DDB_G0283139 [Dictyostelium discoideum AX4]|eukprot:XP_639232.2 hypothetical protein DDB_G0283139 [Dictyostelium discoideum AX4]
MIFSNLILSTILLLFFITALKSSESIFSSITQTGNDLEIKLAKPLYVLNITSLDYLYHELNGTSVLNSCIFNSNFYSLNLTRLKDVVYRFEHKVGSSYYHFFSICSEMPSFKSQSVVAILYGNIADHIRITGNLNTETFELGRFGFDNFALKLTYKNPTSGVCYNGNNEDYRSGTTRNYYFQCDENQEFNFTPPSTKYSDDCNVDVYIKTKYVCPYKNIKITPIKYSLIQPNILRFSLDENSSNLISVNNDNNDFQVLPIKPIINSCENNGDIITVNGLFLKNLQLKYTFNFQGGHTIDPSNIISFNSTTLVINSTGFVDNNFFISLFENKSESYPILKPQQQMELRSFINYYLYIDCINCDGANLMGLSKNYTKNRGEAVKVDIYDITLNDNGGIYFEAPIYPFKRSGALQLPTDFRKISDNEIFQFNGSSIVSISGLFIPKVYDNQAYIIGKLEFSNGTIYNLDYNTLNNNLLSEGKFNIPSGNGNGNFSIYIKDKMVHSNAFNYQPPLKWISSFTQNQEKVQLHLSFPFSLFPITSIKYNDKNGKDLDYTLIEPNIISFNLNTYSTNVFSFNDDYHNETLTNGLNFRPIIYSYSIENDIITMEGLFLSKLSNYNFYLDDIKNAVSYDQVTYFDISRLSLIMNQASHVYVYSDENSFTKVPDITITSEQDQLLFTCSNCLGGYINIDNPQSNQDSQFSQIGTIVKQFNTKTIFNKYNIFTFTKDSKTIVIQPPLPTNLIVHEYSAQFSTFSNNTIIVSGDFLMDSYNGFDYIDFQFQFDNGTIHSAKKQLLSKSDQNYKYQINAPFAYGSGNFSASVTFENIKKTITNSFPFYYPTKPIVTSISTINDLGLTISGDGFFGVKIFGSFKTITLIEETGLFSVPTECEYTHDQVTNTKIYCRFYLYSPQYSQDDPITIQIRNSGEFEPLYTQTFFYDSKFNPEILNNDISLHSVFSKLLATLFIILSILLQ